MKAEDDRTSLGNILLQLGMVDDEQLRQAVEQQEGDPDVLLGKLLIAAGVIDAEDLETALSAQAGLRSKRRGNQAQAEASIAQHRTRRVVEVAGRVAACGQRVVQAMTEKRQSGEYLSVAPYLARKGDD